MALLIFFSKKVSDIRAATDGSPPPDIRTSPTTPMSVFQPVTEAHVRRVIMKSPSKSSSLDPIPTYLLKEVVDSLLPYITALVNASLQQGHLPTSQKRAIVTPLLKKPGADTADMGNYRPVSNLSFLSKTVERVVAEQLNSYLMDNGLMSPLQSAYRRCHSTETALLCVMADVFAAADQQRVTLLALLDLSTAFDCVDHDILLLGCLDVSLTGFAPSSSTALSVWRTLVAVRGLSACCGVYHKAPYSDRCCFCCMRPSFSTLSQHTEQQPTSMRMTVNCTSARWRLTLTLLSVN